METKSPQQDFSYRQYIEREFRSRCSRNPRYSLRAFARDLEMHPSKLSEVLRRTCGLSAISAFALTSKLRLNEVESKHFVTLVEVEHSRSSARKRQALEILKEFQAQHKIQKIDLEKAKIISDWHHNAILELLMLEQYQTDPQLKGLAAEKWMAQQLATELKTIQLALQRLEKFSLIRKAGEKWETVDETGFYPGNIPSREIREHHHQMIQKATQSIDEVEITARDITSMILAIDETNFAEAQKMIQKFRHKFADDLQKSKNRSRVYGLTIQFFPLSRRQTAHQEPK